jgi:DNA-binding PadR family transcriptional regulator
MARTKVATTQELGPGDWAVLALVSESQVHGWAIAAQLARGGEVGSIWSLGRPLVYHALGHLEREGLIRTAALERGERGPHRVIYDATAKGRKAVREWLLLPVDRVRDIRSLFLLKVVLCQRQGIDLEPLLTAQRRLIVPFVAWLESQLDDADPATPTERTALAFRLETAQMVVRFIDGMLDAQLAGATAAKGAKPAKAAPAIRGGARSRATRAAAGEARAAAARSPRRARP